MTPAPLNFLENSVSQGIPKYLYHMTTKQNYRAIMKDGFLRTHNDRLCGQGVFIFDIKNYFEKWKDVFSEQRGKNFTELLLDQVSKRRNKIVMLRIPTDKLDIDKLAIRSQNRLHKYCYTDIVRKEIEPEATVLANLFQRGEEGEELLLRKKFMQETSKDHNLPDVDHCFNGAPALEAQQYEQEAIEYIYRDNIPISDIEKVGEVDKMWCKFFRKYGGSKPVKSIFDRMLKGTPEAQATTLLDC